MDNLQATVLNFRLKNLKKIINKGGKILNYMKKYLNKNYTFFPDEKSYQFNTYHTFVIQVNKRDNLKKYLKKNNIDTAIHCNTNSSSTSSKILGYKEGSFQNAETQAKRILTLPINQFLREKEIKFISEKINSFFEK